MTDTAVQTHLDLAFPVGGTAIPLDHGYALYGATARVAAWLHAEEAKSAGVGIFPIAGTPGGDGTLLLHDRDRSMLRFRVPADAVPKLLPLSGQVLKIDGHALRVGVPRVAGLAPASSLTSPLVLIKLANAGEKARGQLVTPEAFLAAARKQLDALGIRGEPGIPLHRAGPHTGEPRRRVIKVREQTHAGYALLVESLTAEESIRLQEAGLGGRRLMGCGLFLPARGERA